MSSAPYFKNKIARYPEGGTGYLMTRTHENQFYIYDSAGALQSIVDASGKKQILDYSTASTPPSVAPAAGFFISLSDNFGRSLALNYNANGNLIKLIDPEDGLVQYTYPVPPAGGDANSHALTVPSARLAKPATVQYPGGGTKAYHWDEPAWVTTTPGTPSQGLALLTGITDELGNRYASFGYLDGKAISTEHFGAVQKYSFADSRDPSSVGNLAITYPNGSIRNQTYSLTGNGFAVMTAQDQPAGSGCGASTKNVTYDNNLNITSSTDFAGTTTNFTYNLSRNLETKRIEANGTTVKRTVWTQWHPDWKLEKKVAEPKRITTLVYNGQPDPSNANAILGCAPADALLPVGKPIAVLCKRIEQATSDLTGNAGFSAALSGNPRVWQYTYNADGQMLTERGPRTDVTELTTYAYYSDTVFDPPQTTNPSSRTTGHTKGDLMSTTNALGQATLYPLYDKHGNNLKKVEPSGRTTTYTYDLRQRLTSVTLTPAGGATASAPAQVSSYTYNLAGLLTKATAPDGSFQSYSYDPAQRLTGASDNLGNSVTYTLDNDGNRTAENFKDPGNVLKRAIARTYDALNRVQTQTGVQ